MDEEEQKRRSLFGFGRSVRKRGEETEGEGVDWVNLGGTVAKYGVPLATLLMSANQARRLRDDAQVKLEVPELQTGRVRALRRPNFALRRRDPAGSSLAEFTAGQKFGDAFMRSQELNFESQDEASRIAQENAILDRTNQNTATGAQIRNQQAMMNSQLSAQELLGSNLPLQQDALLGLFHNVQSDVAQYNYNNTTEKSNAVQAILTNPNSTEQDRAWARAQIGMGGRKKRKMSKSKFNGSSTD
jgi:hypothetical protein